MKYKKRLIGHKSFGDTVQITDPCYSKDVWCRKDIKNVKPGDYACIAWLDPDNRRTMLAGIYLKGIIPHYSKMQLVGSIGVDAGLAGFFTNKPDYTPDEWREFCDRLGDKSAWIFDEGFFTSTGWGDGCYPVYVYKNKENEVTAIEICYGGEYE